MKARFVIFDLPFGGNDEFEPLEGRPEFRTVTVRPQDYEGGAQVIILPGSGKTTADLHYLRANGGERIIRQHLSAGGFVVGVCGGYQMLGEKLIDPYHRQGHETCVEGLGFLPITTVFGLSMLNCTTTAELLVGRAAGQTVTGREHRSGHSIATARSSRHVVLHKVTGREPFKPEAGSGKVVPYSPWQPGSEPFDGFVSSDRRIWGTYLHLIFHNQAFLESLLSCLP